MKKTLRNKKGFTLAELLIVVAIIAVLVAIAIPIFTAQLEKAREATDEANLRSKYAECSAAVLSGTVQTASESNDNIAVTESDGHYIATTTYTMTQKKDGLTSGDSINIGGVTLTSDKFKTGTATITVTDNGTKPTIVIE